MSREALGSLEESRALESTRRFEELSLYHVPFDELNGDRQTEDAFTRLVANEGRVAIVGPSGSGKSSLIAAVLGPLAMDLPAHVVPLRVPVATEADDTVIQPGQMAGHLVRYITRWASAERFTEAERYEFEKGVAAVSRRSGGIKGREFHVGLPLWLANVEFARQVQSAGEEYESQPSGADAVEHLKRILALFASHGLFAVLVFDDSDTWLRIPSLDRTTVANAFFMQTVRMLAKELDAGLVLAVHDDYMKLAGYAEARQWLSGEIHIPRLVDALASIENMLRDRLAVVDIQQRLEDVIQAEAIGHLAKHYESGKPIRDVLRVAQRSLQNALSDGTDLITVPLVEQAIAELVERA